MSDPMKNLLDALAQIKPQPRPKSERVYKICAVALYPVWGLLSSALLLNSGFIRSQLPRSIVGIAFAGLLPVALHLCEVRSRKTDFEWETVLISLSLGGILTLFLGTLLHGLLLLCGVHGLFCLRIENWHWKFPEWMSNSDY